VLAPPDEAASEEPKPRLNSAIAASSSLSFGKVPVVAMWSSRSAWLARHERPQLRLETLHVLHGHVVDVTADAGVDHDDLLLYRNGNVQPLLQQLGEAVAAVELRLRGLVEFGAEGGESLELAELGQVDLECANDRLHGLYLRCAANSGDRVTDVERRPHAE